MATTEQAQNSKPESAADEVRRVVSEQGIQFLFAQFVDMHGKPSAKLVPAHHIDDLMSDMGLPHRRTSNVVSEYLELFAPARYRGLAEERRLPRNGGIKNVVDTTVSKSCSAVVVAGQNCEPPVAHSQ